MLVSAPVIHGTFEWLRAEYRNEHTGEVWTLTVHEDGSITSTEPQAQAIRDAWAIIAMSSRGRCIPEDLWNTLSPEAREVIGKVEMLSHGELCKP